MQSIDNFMTEWSNRESVPSLTLNNKRAKKYDGLYVELSRSGRDNTVRINHIKSINPKKGELKKFLKWVTKQATDNGFHLNMAVQPTGHHFEDVPTKEKLKAISEKFGFSVKYEYPDKLGYEMVYEN